MTTGNSVDPIAQFVSYAVVVCWFLFALTFLLRKRPPRGQVTRRDQMALIGIGLQVAASFCVWFRPLQRQFYSPIIPMPQWAEILLAILTLAIAAFSIWLVNAAVRRLGKQWAVSASLVEGHKLVVDGPYHLVRNPIYTGIFGMLIRDRTGREPMELVAAGGRGVCFGNLHPGADRRAVVTGSLRQQVR